MKEWVAFAICLVGAIIISTSMANANETKTITPQEFVQTVKELPSNVSNFVQNEWQETKEFQAESWAKTKEQNAENWKKIKSFFAKLSESN